MKIRVAFRLHELIVSVDGVEHSTEFKDWWDKLGRGVIR